MFFARIGRVHRALGITTLAVLLGSTPAQAAFIFNIDQVGADVVITGSGTLDLTDLGAPWPNSFRGAMQPQFAQLSNGSPLSVPVDVYTGITGYPANLGPGNGGASFPTTGSGDLVFIHPGSITVASGYVSGTPLANVATYANQTLATLGLTPGAYVFSWGAGDHADTVTVNVNAAVPEPAALTLLSGALLACAAGRRHRRTR